MTLLTYDFCNLHHTSSSCSMLLQECHHFHVLHHTGEMRCDWMTHQQRHSVTHIVAFTKVWSLSIWSDHAVNILHGVGRKVKWDLTEVVLVNRDILCSVCCVCVKYLNAPEYWHNECVLFHNLTNLDRSEQNAPCSFSPDCIDLVLIKIDLDRSKSI